MQLVTCLNCENTFQGNFCPQCGQSAHEKRVDAHYFLHDIPHSIFHLEKGFFYTFIALFAKPGAMVSDYLAGRRMKYFRPIAYVVVISTFCTLLVQWMSKGMASIYLANNPNGILPHKEGFFAHYFSAFIFIMIPIVSLVTWLFFYKKRYNFWEHCLANTFIAAQLNVMQVLIYLFALLYVFFTHKMGGINIAVFIPVFMSVFLYLYGTVFGFLMSKEFRLRKLVIRLTLMNLILFFVYTIGFQVTGIMNPW